MPVLTRSHDVLRGKSMKARKAPRSPVEVRGRVRSKSGLEWEVNISDLSVGGCHFPQTGAHLIEGESIWLQIASVGPFRGKVSWRKGKNVGVAFDKLIEAELIEQLLAGDQPAAFPKAGLVRRAC